MRGQLAFALAAFSPPSSLFWHSAFARTRSSSATPA